MLFAHDRVTCAGDIVDALDSISADKFIQCDSSSEESHSDISDV